MRCNARSSGAEVIDVDAKALQDPWRGTGPTTSTGCSSPHVRTTTPPELDDPVVLEPGYPFNSLCTRSYKAQRARQRCFALQRGASWFAIGGRRCSIATPSHFEEV